MRSDLRLEDLRDHPRRVPTKLMNVKVPVDVAKSIHRVANALGCNKTEAFIALINEGLDVAEVELRGMKPVKKLKIPSPDRMCSEPGCPKELVAKGLCSKHYQQQRRR